MATITTKWTGAKYFPVTELSRPEAITYHPIGLPHGPQSGKIKESSK
ncbi:MAG: hypothetical protein V3U16_04915 [Candidatus Neomarinimicrobiota bacterium]